MVIVVMRVLLMSKNMFVKNAMNTMMMMMMSNFVIMLMVEDGKDGIVKGQYYDRCLDYYFMMLSIGNNTNT